MLDRILRRAPKSPLRLNGRGDGDGRDRAEVDEAFLSRLRRVTLASQRKLTSGQTGEHASPRKAHSLEFADYRSYSPGDDFRRVDWNAYQRLDHLFVKLSDAPERLHLQLLLDSSSSMDWGEPNKLGYARRVAGALAYVALAHMDRASLFALRAGECHRLARQESSAATAAMMRALGDLGASGETELNGAITSFMAQESPRGMVVVISDLLSPSGYREGLERLSRASTRVVVVHLLSPEEMDPGLEGDLELEDLETGASLRVTVDGRTLGQYRGWLNGWLREIEQFCAQRGITYVRATTDYPVEQLVLDRFRRERVVR